MMPAVIAAFLAVLIALLFTCIAGIAYLKYQSRRPRRRRTPEPAPSTVALVPPARAWERG
jgi:hypothetical protein